MKSNQFNENLLTDYLMSLYISYKQHGKAKKPNKGLKSNNIDTYEN